MNLDNYSSFIVQKLLRIRKGDALSINTEEISFEFAKKVANKALQITEFPVKIVVTDNGKPVEVTDFEPEGVFAPNTGLAMLRINYIKPQVNDSGSLNVVVEKDDLVTCQRLGHLAEPVDLERRIAVPYCVVPFYVGDDERWNELERKIGDFDANEILIKLRKRNLEEMDIHKLHFIGDKTDFYLELPEDVSFISDFVNLSSGRNFHNSIDTCNLITTVDKNSLEGSFSAHAKVFGKDVVISAVYTKGQPKFDFDSFEFKQLLSFDDEINKPGYLELSDKRFVLYLGGAQLDPVRDLLKYNQLPDFFNQSIYSVALELDNKLSVYAIDCENNEKEIVRKGFFLD